MSAHVRDRLGEVVDRTPLSLDGSYGEGGGQVLRTALALAVVLARPIQLARIRARRAKPGLRPQHQTVVRALPVISDAIALLGVSRTVPGPHLRTLSRAPPG